MLSWFLGVFALAATPVLHLGDAEGALARAAERSSLEPERFAPVAVGGPLQVGGSLVQCQQVSVPEVAAGLAQPTRDLDYGRFAEAAVALDALWRSARCSDLDAATAHRLLVLRGCAAVGEGRVADARASFTDAVRFSSAPWDPSLPADCEVVYEAVRAQPPCCSVRVVPAIPVQLDGRTLVDGELVAMGEHQLRLETGIYRLNVERTAVVIGAPGTRWEDVFAWVEAPERHEDLLAIVRAAVPEGRAVLDGTQRSWQVGPDIVAPLVPVRRFGWGGWTAVGVLGAVGIASALARVAWARS